MKISSGTAISWNLQDIPYFIKQQTRSIVTTWRSVSSQSINEAQTYYQLLEMKRVVWWLIEKELLQLNEALRHIKGFLEEDLKGIPRFGEIFLKLVLLLRPKIPWGYPILPSSIVRVRRRMLSFRDSNAGDHRSRPLSARDNSRNCHLAACSTSPNRRIRIRLQDIFYPKRRNDRQ